MNSEDNGIVLPLGAMEGEIAAIFFIHNTPGLVLPLDQATTPLPFSNWLMLLSTSALLRYPV